MEGFLTVAATVAAAVAALIGVTLTVLDRRKQWRKDQNELHQHPDRKAVYDAAMNLASHIVKKRVVTPEELGEFTDRTRDASLIFGDNKIQAYCDKMREQACEVLSISDALKDQDSLPDSDRVAKMKELDLLFEWFRKQRDDEIKRIFAHSLQIR